MTFYLRYNMKFRRMLIKLSYIMPNKIKEWIEEWLYPDDLILWFR